MSTWLERYRQLQREGQKAPVRPAPVGASPPPSTTHAEGEQCPEEAEVAWRVAGMREQVPPAGPIPFLLARSELADTWRELGRDHCHSCGDALPEGYAVGIAPRCTWCQRAAELACNTVREGMTREP